MKKLYLAGVFASALIFGITTSVSASVVTFSETISSAPGFNGQNNEFLTTSDGAFRVESFWLGQTGHMHETTNINGTFERNHNQAAGTGTLSQLQGVRITRNDGNAFSLQSLELFGEVAIGTFSDFTGGTGGSWNLFSDTSGSLGLGALVNLGSAYGNLTEIFLADSFALGGTSRSNSWDNINLGVSTVPVPAAFWLFGSALVGFFGFTRRKATA